MSYLRAKRLTLIRDFSGCLSIWRSMEGGRDKTVGIARDIFHEVEGSD